jgi:hypothetical protein
MKYEIVQFKSENINFNSRFFGIRRRKFFQSIFNYGGDYFDLKDQVHFWNSDSAFFEDCKTQDVNLIFYLHSKLTNNVVEEIIK